MAALVDDRAGRCALPVGAFEKVDEVDAERVFRLPNLPLLPAAFTFEVLAESADLVGDGFVGGRVREEAADPAHAIRRGLLPHKSCLQEELAKLLERSLELAHRRTTSAALVGNGCASVAGEDRHPIALAVKVFAAAACGCHWSVLLEASTPDVITDQQLALSTFARPGVLRPPEPIHGG